MPCKECQEEGEQVMGSNDEFVLGAGMSHELEIAIRRNSPNTTKADIQKLCSGKTWAEILPFLRGNAEIKIVRHIIDLDASPFVPEGCKVEEHRKGGQFEWNSSAVKLFPCGIQQGDKGITGHDSRKELADKPVFNANLLDYLLAHPDLIPKEWKEKVIYFWGTIYEYAIGNLFVSGLFYDDYNVGQWVKRIHFLDDNWYGPPEHDKFNDLICKAWRYEIKPFALLEVRP